jgi:hypothetical protein
MKNINYIVVAVFIGLGTLLFLSFSGSIEGTANAGVRRGADNTDTLGSIAGEVSMIQYFPVKIPAEISFAGERVPLEDSEVMERMDRELTVNAFWHSSTIQNLKLAHRWFPVIEQILKENNIPDDFKYVAMAESGLRNAVSPSGAHGIWQFLEATGEQYGLKVTDQVDERYHLEKSTLAATKYLQEAYQKFGNWTLAAAAYNAGMNGIQSVVSYQKQNNYYNLYLKDETSRYVFRVLAFKLLYENTQQYGFMLGEEDLYDPLTYRTIKINSSIANLADFAISNNITYKMVKYLNPWLRSQSLTVKPGETYEIKLPVEVSSNDTNSPGE